MNPGRYFIPNMIVPFNNPTPLTITNLRNGGLINRIFSGFKTLNWKGLLSGANKTINVVNQAIPLIRQTKPMINNVKSIVSLTKAFNRETVPQRFKQTNHQAKPSTNIKYENDSHPTFFV